MFWTHAAATAATATTSMTLASLEAMTWSIVTGAVTAVLWLAASPPDAFDASTQRAASTPAPRDATAEATTRTVQAAPLLPRVAARDPTPR